MIRSGLPFLKSNRLLQRPRKLASRIAPRKATDVRGNPGNSRIFVTGTPPSGGTTPDSYNAIARPTSPPGSDVTVNASPTTNPDGTVTIEITPLTNGTVYDVFLQPVSNTQGNGPLSDAGPDNQNIIPFTNELSDLGAKYWGGWFADHLSVSGSDINTILDQSGNALDVAYISGTKFTVASGAFNGVDGILFSSNGRYHNTDSLAVNTTKRVGISLFKVPSGGGGNGPTYYTTNEYFEVHNDDSIVGLNVATLAGGAPRGLVSINTLQLDMSQPTGHKVKTWLNGDQTTTGDANLGAINSPNVLIAIGSQDGANEFNAGLMESSVLLDNPSADQIQLVEGIVAWRVPSAHLLLVSGHPWREKDPSGDFAAPATPTITRAYPSASGQITVVLTPGDEGGATVTYYCTSDNAITGSGQGTSTTTHIDVTGLTNGVARTFTARAQSIAGSSAASSASASVTPTASTLVPFAAQFKMNGASGANENDIFGGYVVAPAGGGTCGSTTGLVGNARTFDGSVTLKLNTTTDGVIGCNNTDFTIEFAGNATTTNKQMCVACVDTGGSTGTFFIRIEAGGALTAWVGDGSGAFDSVALGTITANTTFTIKFGFVWSTKQARWSFNQGAVQTATMAQHPAGSTAQLATMEWHVGGHTTTSFGMLIGWVDCLGIQNRCESDAELQASLAEF